jgi:hypothetical protein
MVRRFRHPVNEADRFQGGSALEGRVTVKGAGPRAKSLLDGCNDKRLMS